MKSCDTHWKMLRDAVDNRGLSKFITPTPEEAMARTVRSLEGESLESDWDPLMCLYWNLCGYVTDVVGLYIMSDRGAEHDGMPANRDESGFNHVCPLCVIRRDFDLHNTESGRCGNEQCQLVVKPGDTPWDERNVNEGADAMLEFALEKGLITRS